MSTRLFGFELKIRAEFLVMSVLLGYSSGSPTALATWCVVVLVSVLLHELGHAFVARYYGYRPWIELYGMGGLTHCEVHPARSVRSGWRTDLAIALAGPGVSLLIGGAVYSTSRPWALPATLDDLVRQMLWVNVGWSAWNLLPLLPTDGGLAFKALVERVSPPNGFSLPHRVTIALGTAGFIAALVARQWWLGYLAGRSVIASWRALGEARHEERVDAAWELWDAGGLDEARQEIPRLAAAAPTRRARGLVRELDVFLALRALRSDEASDAFDGYESVQTPSPLLRAVVLHGLRSDSGASALLSEVSERLLARVLVPLVLAWAASADRVWTERARALTRMPIPHDVAQTLGEKLFFAGQYDLSAELHELLFERFGEPAFAYNAACSHAKATRLTEGLRWLERALAGGFSDDGLIERDADLDGLRNLPEFSAICEASRVKED